MAPSLAAPETARAPTSSIKGVGDYKEAYGVAGGPNRYNADSEINGTATQPKASHPQYLPSWDFSTT